MSPRLEKIFFNFESQGFFDCYRDPKAFQQKAKKS